MLDARPGGLLDPAGTDDEHARLQQAAHRSDFLVRVHRLVSAVAHPYRALDAAVSLLTDGVVDFAQVSVVYGRDELFCSATTGRAPRIVSHRSSSRVAPTLASVIARDLPEGIAVPSEASAWDEVVAGAVPDEQARDQLRGLAPGELHVFPMTVGGRTIGSLTVARRRGAGADAAARQFLADIADHVAGSLQVSLLLAQSRHAAVALRGQLLPAHLPDLDHVEFGAVLRLAEQGIESGGDFLDVHGPDDDVTIVLGDVVGKGIEAASLARRIRHAVRTASLVDRSPDAMLALVNRVLLDEMDGDDEQMCTAVAGRVRLGPDGLRIDLASAGHPPAVIVRNDQIEPELSVAAGPMLGLLPEAEFEVASYVLAPGETMLLYTDGLLEARDPEGGFFGEERLAAHLIRDAPPGAVIEALEVAVDQFVRGGDATDDIAMLAVRHKASR